MHMLALPNINLSSHNTLAVNCTAEYFAECTTLDDIKACINWARSQQLEMRILGGGSNALLPEYISGLVIKPLIMGREIIQKNEGHYYVRCGAGENWHEFVQWTLSRHCFGLENLSLIPGTVGAAPIQNIGAYGVEVGNMISKVYALHAHDFSLHEFTQSQCQFDYRDSVFKREGGNQYIIYSVEFKLSTQFSSTLTYPALASLFAHKKIGSICAEDVAEAVIRIRTEKLPQPQDIPNAGSFFKNPIVSLSFFEELKHKYHDIVAFDVPEKGKKIAAAWLIDQAGWKQKTTGAISVHTTQALVIINPDRQPLTEILAHARNIQMDVENKFGICLEIEPQHLNPLQV